MGVNELECRSYLSKVFVKRRFGIVGNIHDCCLAKPLNFNEVGGDGGWLLGVTNSTHNLQTEQPAYTTSKQFILHIVHAIIQTSST